MASAGGGGGWGAGNGGSGDAGRGTVAGATGSEPIVTGDGWTATGDGPGRTDVGTDAGCRGASEMVRNGGNPATADGPGPVAGAFMGAGGGLAGTAPIGTSGGMPATGAAAVPGPRIGTRSPAHAPRSRDSDPLKQHAATIATHARATAGRRCPAVGPDDDVRERAATATPSLLRTAGAGD